MCDSKFFKIQTEVKEYHIHAQRNEHKPNQLFGLIKFWDNIICKRIIEENIKYIDGSNKQNPVCAETCVSNILKHR